MPIYKQVTLLSWFYFSLNQFEESFLCNSENQILIQSYVYICMDSVTPLKIFFLVNHTRSVNKFAFTELTPTHCTAADYHYFQMYLS